MLHLNHDLLQHDAQLFPRLQRLNHRALPSALLLVGLRVLAPLRTTNPAPREAHARTRARRASRGARASNTSTSLSCCLRSSAACVASRSLSRTSSAVVLSSSSASVSSLQIYFHTACVWRAVRTWRITIIRG